jgi:hypothetical protein
MVTEIEPKLQNLWENKQTDMTDHVALFEADVSFKTSNFNPSSYSLVFAKEESENADEDYSQTYYWTNEWQESESQSDEDIRTTRVRAFNSVDDLISELES